MTRSLLGAVTLLLLLPLVAHAHFFRSRYAAAYATPVYYYPAYYPAAAPVTVSAYVVAPPRVVLYDPLPVYVAQPSPVCAPVVPAVTLPTAPPPLAVPPYAPPSAAPPSGYPATPGTLPAPSTPSAPPGESPSSTLMTSAAKTSAAAFYDVYPVASRPGAAPAGDRRPVSFWNLSGHDVVLKVDGQTQTLPPGSRSRLELGRQFGWQVDGHEARNEEMAPGAAGLEIVLRR